MPRALILGAGCVGQVFARHLQLAGTEVTFYVREKYREALSKGLDMYELGHGAPRAVRFENYQVLTSLEAVASERFDFVYIAISATAMLGDWLKPFLKAIGNAAVVSMQSSDEGRRLILEGGISPERVVDGYIGFISYDAPLHGETRFPKPGTAYWFPPVSNSNFSGPPALVDEVVSTLKRGKLPAQKVDSVERSIVFPTAVFMTWLLALEAAKWSLEGLVSGPSLAAGERAVAEMMDIVAVSEGPAPLWLHLLLSTSSLRLGLPVVEKMAPLPLETYLQKHFTKVGGQTRRVVSTWVERGRAAGKPTEALSQLLASVGP